MGYISPMQFKNNWLVAQFKETRVLDWLRTAKCRGKVALR